MRRPTPTLDWRLPRCQHYLKCIPNSLVCTLFFEVAERLSVCGTLFSPHLAYALEVTTSRVVVSFMFLFLLPHSPIVSLVACNLV